MRRLVLPLLLPLLSIASCGPGGADSAAPGGAEAVTEQAAPQSSPDLQPLIEAGDLDGIVAALQPRFDAENISTEHARLLAEARMRQKEVPKAVQVLRETLRREPAATEVSLLLADVYTSLNQDSLALDALLAAREAGGGDNLLALPLGLTYGRLDRLEESRAELDRARAAGGDAEDIDYNTALVLMEQGHHSEAQGLLEGILEREPSAHVQRELARAYLVQGNSQLDAVRELCNSVLAENDEDWRAWEILADADMRVGDFQAAQAYYTKALEFGTKEIGNNPPRVEEKYTAAVRGLRDELREEGLLPSEDPTEGRSGPPIPESVRERMRESQKKAAGAGAGDGQGS